MYEFNDARPLALVSDGVWSLVLDAAELGGTPGTAVEFRATDTGTGPRVELVIAGAVVGDWSGDLGTLTLEFGDYGIDASAAGLVDFAFNADLFPAP